MFVAAQCGAETTSPCDVTFVITPGVGFLLRCPVSEFVSEVLEDLPRHRRCLQQAADDISTTVEISKRILLNHRVRDFAAADVVALTALILAREGAIRSTDV